jgi:hypothetical protein
MILADLARVLEQSDERDRYERRILNAWHEGFAAAEATHADDYSLGYAAAIADVKSAEHDIVRAFQAQAPAARWSVRGQRRTRHAFADPHPGDYPGGPLPLEHPGKVWLGGQGVHRHNCSQACRSCRPGWYTPAEAARILAGLPGDYAGEIERLTAMSAEGCEAA